MPDGSLLISSLKGMCAVNVSLIWGTPAPEKSWKSIEHSLFVSVGKIQKPVPKKRKSLGDWSIQINKVIILSCMLFVIFYLYSRHSWFQTFVPLMQVTLAACNWIVIFLSIQAKSIQTFNFTRHHFWCPVICDLSDV